MLGIPLSPLYSLSFNSACLRLFCLVSSIRVVCGVDHNATLFEREPHPKETRIKQKILRNKKHR